MRVFLSIPLLALLLTVTGTSGAAAEGPGLVLVSWNIEHLAARNGSGCRPRGDTDYRALREYISARAPDIVAFQEVENETAARRVFDPEHYRVYVSSRPAVELGQCYERQQPLRMQRTGFAVRRDLQQQHDLAVRLLPDVDTLGNDGLKSRWGVHLVLEPAGPAAGGPPLHLLSIHLKSGCAFDDLDREQNPACPILAAQVPRLEHWIETRIRQGQLFLVLGDFNRQLDQLGDPIWQELDDSELCEWQTPAGGVWRCRPGTARFSHGADLEKARAGLAHPRPWNPRYPYAVDHIIYPKAVDQGIVETASRFDERAARHSDHLPLFIRLELTRIGGP